MTADLRRAAPARFVQMQFRAVRRPALVVGGRGCDTLNRVVAVIVRARL